MTTQLHLTTKDIQQRLAVADETVRTWIHSKELRAVNISKNPARPRWRISEGDLTKFLEQRSNQATSS